MNDAKTMSSYHFGKRLISLILAVMLVIGLCASGISVNAATTGTASTGADQYVYKLVDTMTAGHDYLIVNTNKAGSAYALKNDGGSSSGTSLNKASVTVKSADVDKDGSADLYITSPSISTIWTATANAEGFALTNDDEFLEGKSGNIKIFTEQQYPDRYWHYTDQQLIFENPETGDRAVDYTLYYSSSSFTQATSSNSNKIYIYEKTAVDEIPAEVETQAPTVAPITGNYVFKLTDTMKAGGEYLIVTKKEAGSAYALANEGASSSGTSLARSSVTVTSGDLNNDSVADTYIASATTDLVWTASTCESGFKLTNDGGYLEGKSGNIKIFDAIQYEDRYWTYEDSQLRFVGSSTTYTLYYSSSNFTQSTSSSSSSSRELYIYEKVAVDQIPTQVVTQAPTSAPITGDFVFKYVETMTPGHDYLIVSKNEAGSAYAMKNEGGSSSGTSMARSSVTISSGDVDKDGSADLYIAEASSDIVWTATANEGGFNLTNGSDILEGKSGNVKIYDSVQYSDRYWTYNDQLLQHNGGQNTYTVYYSSSSFTSSYQDTAKVYVFEKTSTSGSITPVTQAPTQAPTVGDYAYKLVSAVTPGNDYLIVSNNAAGSAVALKNDGGSSSGASMGKTNVTVANGDIDNDGSADLYIAEAASDLVWTATANEGGFTLTNGSDYLEGKSGNLKIFSSQQYPARYWTYEDSQLVFINPETGTSGSNSVNYTLYYSGSSFTQATSSSSEKIYVYEKTATNGSVQPATQAPATQAPATQKPTSAPYTGNAVNVGFTSDVHDNTDSLRLFLTAAQNDYTPKLDAVGYCGDYSYQMNKSGHVSAFNEIVSINNELVGENTGYYTTGNHEYLNASGIIEAIQDTPGFKIFGEQKRTNQYIIFAMGAESSSDAYTEDDIAALDSYMASVPSDIPVFITTHYPLHTYSSRTTKNADKVIDVLNQYPNAVFFWGHNHTMSDSHYGEILTSGDSITYASGKSKNINFTYLAAGALYRASQTPYGGVVATIEGSNVTFQYYRSAASEKIGDALTVSMIGEPVVNPTSAPATQKPTAAPITGDYVFQLTDTMKAGGEYLIVNKNEAGSAYALTNEGGSSSGTSLARTSVTVSSGDFNKDNVTDTYIASASSDLVWLATASGDGFKLTNNGDYLEGKSGNIKIFDDVQYEDRYWTYDDSQLRFVGSSTTYTLYYSNSNFTQSTSSSSSSSRQLYIYEKVAVDEIPTVAPATQAPATQRPTTAPATQAPQTQPATQAPATQKPTSAPYTGNAVNVGFTSDVHDSTDELRSWITYVQNAYDPDLDAMGYCGDYSYNFNLSGHVNSFNEIVSITNELVGENKGYYTCGNHEWMNASGIVEAIQDTPNWKIFGELRKTDAYTIFAMGAETSSDAYTDEDIEALDQYLANTYTDRPIFIITHYPLHTNSSRTTKNADKVIEVCNQYPNVVWLWGHNHSQSDSHYGEILTAGDSITYASGKSKEINFTYLAAGGMYRESQVKNNSGLVCTIEGSDVTFRYHRSSTGEQVGNALKVSMIGDPVERPTSGPTEPPTERPTAAPVTGDFVFKLTDTMKAGGEYLIVNTNKAGNAYSLKNEGGSSSGTSLARNSVNIQKSDLNSDGVEDTYIVSGTTDTVWLASANVDGYRLTNNGDYLEGKSNKISIYNSVQNSDRYWTYSNNQLKFAGGSSTYSFYYSSNNFTGSTSSNSGKLYIYEKTSVDTMPTEVKPTEAPPIVAGEGTNLGFTSDVHGSMDRLENWLDAVQNAYDPNLDAMTYCGDYSYVTNSTSNYLADFNEVVSITNSKVGSGKGIYTSGNHEYYTNGEQSKLDSGFTNTPGFTRIGEAKVADNYRIYCMGAAGWFSANGEYPQADIDALDAYLDSAPTDVPIFIAAHFPLHYFAGSSSGWGGSSGRTITNADKMIDVLNEHPNAVFFWGHNHSQSDPEYGTIKTAGDSITYASGKSKDINFTYASVGAIYDDDQTMYSGVVATVSDSGDKVIFRYWNAGNGKQLGDTYTVNFAGTAGLRGDADNNGVVEILDATVIQRYLAEITPSEIKSTKNADADLNGKIDILDALAIQRVQAGICTWDELDAYLKG